MLSSHILEEIALWIRASVHTKRELLDLFCEEMYAPGELDRKEVEAAALAEYKKWWNEKQQYPDVTDSDRLDDAMEAISERGVISLQAAGCYTLSDAHDEFLEQYEDHPDKSSVIGYCYYCGQDYERVAGGGDLFISFGPVDPKKEDTLGVEVGELVREEIERIGLKVDWDGTFGSRLRIPSFKWQRR